jgi:hypothetical protein
LQFIPGFRSIFNRSLLPLGILGQVIEDERNYKDKGELRTWYQLTPLASVNASGLKVKGWVTVIIQICEQKGRVQGHACCDQLGKIVKPQ